jgi:hypothetical protein
MFTLDRETGKLFWLNPPKRLPYLKGEEAGLPNKANTKFYWVIQINGKKIKRSRLVYYMVNGKWPDNCIDHINGDSLDDRPENIREATVTQNSWNHRTRLKKQNLPMGVRKNGKFETYTARIGYNKKMITIGTFKTIEEAQNAYITRKKELYGEYAGIPSKN